MSFNQKVFLFPYTVQSLIELKWLAVPTEMEAKLLKGFETIVKNSLEQVKGKITAQKTELILLSQKNVKSAGDSLAKLPRVTRFFNVYNSGDRSWSGNIYNPATFQCRICKNQNRKITRCLSKDISNQLFFTFYWFPNSSSRSFNSTTSSQPIKSACLSVKHAIGIKKWPHGEPPNNKQSSNVCPNFV